MGHPVIDIGEYARRVLPSGRALSDDDWTRRHRQICVLLWLHVPGLFVYAVVSGESIGHALVEAGVVAAFALGAIHRAVSRTTAAALATVGLMSASAVLIHISGGLIEMHFHFFVMVVVVSLYQAWFPFLVALGYVILHHGIGGALAPESVFNHPSALAHPWRWALIHGGFILAQSVVCLVAWRTNEEALHGEQHARARLERANSDLAEAQAISKIGSWEWELATGELVWSEELYRILGRDPERFVPTYESFFEVIHPDDRFRVAAILDSVNADSGELNYECQIVREDGEVRSIHALAQPVFAEDGSLLRMVGTGQDITQRKELESEIQHRAFHDQLTGLGNRALFLDRLDHALALRERSNAPLSVLYLDVDDFKTVNDSLGHSVGDELLGEIGRRLGEVVRPSDTIARLGGDEFAVLLEHADVEAAGAIADRIIAALRVPVDRNGMLLTVRASIGLACASDESGASDLIRDADVAMYAAKRDGKGECRVFSQDMLSSVVNRMELEADLRVALQQGQFVLHYQPIVSLRTGRVEGVEALMRWEHPRRGRIYPDAFIPLAEETGLIVPIGEWVVGEATRDARTLQSALGSPVKMSVNLSPRQLASDIVGTVRAALGASGLHPEDLVLEVTETSVMNQQEDGTIDQLHELRALGVRIAIDDFGTGYSSLAYLRQLPVDILKIDRSFVQSVDDGPEESALAKAIVKLAGTFGLRTVAEGIETAEQARTLSGFGCLSGQGYHFYRPFSLARLIERLRDEGGEAAPSTESVSAEVAPPVDMRVRRD